MHVHLIKSPDYPVEEFTEVIDLLRGFSGPLNFVSSQLEFQKEDFFFLTRDMRSPAFSGLNVLQKKFYFPEKGMPLSWRELFSLCRYYREAIKLQSDDFVILLTERMNMMNWFSMFEPERNAFIHCSDWQLFTDAPPQYPIAYEVMANVLRCLMKPDLDHPEKSFHQPSIGCMNDLCLQKSEIILKLKTADICRDCHQFLVDAGVEDAIIEQSFLVFEGMRTQLLFRKSLKRKREPVNITLNHQRRLMFPDLGNLELKLTPLEKTSHLNKIPHLPLLRFCRLPGCWFFPGRVHPDPSFAVPAFAGNYGLLDQHRFREDKQAPVIFSFGTDDHQVQLVGIFKRLG